MQKTKAELIFHEPEGTTDVTLVEGTGISNRFPRHVHSSFIFTLVTHGKRKISINNQTTTYNAGDLCILPPGTPHSCESIYDGKLGPHSYRALCVNARYMAQIATEISGQPCGEPDFDPTAIYTDYDGSSFDELFLLNNIAGTKLERQAALNSFLYQIIEKHSCGEITPQEVGQQHESLQRVKDQIDQNFQQQLTLHDLAQTACLSPFHLQKLFINRYGRSPQEYIIFQRVQNARALIQKGTPISEAAQNSGFFDQSHFSRHFKKVIGISPGQFFKKNG